MAAYEVTLIFKPEFSEEQVDAFVDKLEVEVTDRQKWGKRLFAYPIKKYKEGVYILCDVTAPTNQVKKLEQTLNVHDDVLRYLIIEKGKSN